VQQGHAYHAGSLTAQALTNTGYRQVGIDGINYKAHRLAWFYVHGAWPEYDIDHINGVRHDNRIANLRPATRGENIMNSQRRSDAKSEYRGVHYHKSTKQWQASFRGKYLGIRRTEEEARQLYLTELEKLSASFPLPLHPDHGRNAP